MLCMGVEFGGHVAVGFCGGGSGHGEGVLIRYAFFSAYTLALRLIKIWEAGDVVL